ncbi:hypothetical protein HD712_02260 [Clostridium gasigenes]|nr:hypothetical protein [Clostridium gasigenes]
MEEKAWNLEVKAVEEEIFNDLKANLENNFREITYCSYRNMFFGSYNYLANGTYGAVKTRGGGGYSQGQVK